MHCCCRTGITAVAYSNIRVLLYKRVQAVHSHSSVWTSEAYSGAGHDRNRLIDLCGKIILVSFSPFILDSS